MQRWLHATTQGTTIVIAVVVPFVDGHLRQLGVGIALTRGRSGCR